MTINSPKLSTGEPSTLGVYRKLSVAVWGEDSPQVRFLDSKIAESERGEEELVLAHESQMLYLLGRMSK